MNKYQEALDIIADNIGRNKKHSTWEDGILTICPKWNEAYMTLKQLIDKETPMKPIQKPIGTLGLEIDLCICGTAVNSGRQSRCSECGQAMDWSDSDESK